MHTSARGKLQAKHAAVDLSSVQAQHQQGLASHALSFACQARVRQQRWRVLCLYAARFPCAARPLLNSGNSGNSGNVKRPTFSSKSSVSGSVSWSCSPLHICVSLCARAHACRRAVSLAFRPCALSSTSHLFGDRVLQVGFLPSEPPRACSFDQGWFNVDPGLSEWQCSVLSGVGVLMLELMDTPLRWTLTRSFK